MIHEYNLRASPFLLLSPNRNYFHAILEQEREMPIILTRHMLLNSRTGREAEELNVEWESKTNTLIISV